MIDNFWRNRLNIDCNILALACFDATKAWVENEAYFIKKFSSEDPVTSEDFKSFLKIWQVERNTIKDKRKSLLKLLNEINLTSHETVLSVAKKAKDRGYSSKVKNSEPDHRLPISLISKFAFCRFPKTFTPIDRLSLKGMNKLKSFTKELTLKNEDYFNFCIQFDKISHIIENKIGEKEWTNRTFQFGSEYICEDLFSRRVTDKYLLIFGRGDLKSIDREIRLTENTFSKDAYDLLR